MSEDWSRASPGFRIANGINKYDGTAKPDTWLTDYVVACNIGGGNERVAICNLPLMLEGSAWAWLNSLPEDNIHDWDDLRDAFLKFFEGTSVRSGLHGTVELCQEGR